MVKRIASGIALAFSVILAAAALAEPVHKEIPYSKKVSLTTPKTYTFHFSIYDAVTNGTELWYEEKSVRLRNRNLSHNLGSLIAFADADAGPMDAVPARPGGRHSGGRTAGAEHPRPYPVAERHEVKAYLCEWLAGALQYHPMRGPGVVSDEALGFKFFEIQTPQVPNP